ncbi:prepilin-type N-terminal cleavage/methylation domain-containing protein [Cerasicoccus frondis]|uniref:prepilin-type N-terminal cleavage/methylation domain-containing protein n=1 Tax=Cerasicoccus frondis TaxID=490090 RepID=UPI002852AD2C|nr:prepilin-type N-terminal cleavage/methylation domain-containing protein [Cerasicoccus frondis]
MLYHRPVTQYSPNRRPGFTLVELLVVIAIIAILSSIVFGLTRGIAVKQARTKAEAELQALATALESYKLKYGDYPWLGEDSDSSDLFEHLTGEKKMVPGSTAGNPDMVNGGQAFVNEEDFTISNDRFMDPWGGNYAYYYKDASDSGSSWRYPGFILVCLGADGAQDDSGLATGEIPKDYFDDDNNLDNFVYGLEF